MSEDWLDTSTELELLPVPAELPVEPLARATLAAECWARLNEAQKRFLTAYRDNRLNARKTNRALSGRDETYSPHTGWMRQRDYATIVRLWRGQVADDALNRDRLLARQDDIVETLLTPKPVLHQGMAVFDPRRPGEILEEVEAGAASKANETLMRAAGLLKDKDIDVNVGLIGPSLTIQVVQPDSTVIDVTPHTVAVALPEPEADWTDGP